MTRNRKTVSLALLAAVALTGLSLPEARAAEGKDVLKLVPADAWGFVMIRSLETVDQRAAQLKKTLGLGIPVPITPMALGMLNVGDTIDMKSPLCLVMMDVQKFGAADPGDATVLIAPATDPKALLEKLGPAESKPKGEGDQGNDADAKEDDHKGLVKCNLMGQESYAAIKGKFVILGKNPDCVTHVSKTKKTLSKGFAEARLTALSQSDLYLSVSVHAVLTAYKDMVLPMLQMAGSALDPEGKGITQFVNMLMEMKALDLTVSLDEGGLRLRYLILPEADSDLQKLMKSTKNVSKSLVSVLPNEKYLLAVGATAGNSEHAEKVGQQNPLATLLKASQIKGMDEKAVKTLDSEMQKLIKSVKSLAISFSALPSGTDGMIGMTFAVETADAKAFLESMRTMYKTIWTVSDDEDLQTIKENVIHAADAETVAGHKVDTVTLKLPGLADLFEIEKDDLKTAQTILGKEIAFRFGAVDKKHFLCAFGGGKARFAKAVEAMTSRGGASLANDGGIESLSKKLHSPRSWEGYVAVDNIAQLVKTIAKAAGHEDEIPFELPALNAPVVFGGAQIGRVQQGDLYVPMKLITAVKSAFEQMSKAEMKDFDEDEDEDSDGDDAKTGGGE